MPAGFEFGLGLGPDFGAALGLGPSDAAHTISSDLCSSACCVECDQWDMSGAGDDRDDLHVEVPTTIVLFFIVAHRLFIFVLLKAVHLNY